MMLLLDVMLTLAFWAGVIVILMQFPTHRE